MGVCCSAGGRLSQRSRVTLTAPGKNLRRPQQPPADTNFFHQGNRVPICGIGDVVALEIYSAKLSWHYNLLPNYYIWVIKGGSVIAPLWCQAPD